MARLGKVLVLLLTTALIVTTVGWVQSSRDPDWKKFDSCAVADGVLTLNYTYGANERTAVVFDSRGDDATVALEIVGGAKAGVLEGYTGTATFAWKRSLDALHYPDGSQVECTES